MHVVNDIEINKIVLIFRNKYCYRFYLFYILFIKKKIIKKNIFYNNITNLILLIKFINFIIYSHNLFFDPHPNL